MSNSHVGDVARFYDTHPINEEEILAKLTARGLSLDALTQDDLKDFDQDHYGGTGAVDALAGAAGLHAGHHVLDVCSGMGGPARWLAQRYGCRVTGIDLTRSRVESAIRLTQRVGLQHRVDFRQGDATAMPFGDGGFDAALSQEAWCHIPDKRTLLGECARVVKAGGMIAFTDIVTLTRLDAQDERRLSDGMFITSPPSIDEYRRLLNDCSCELVQCIDLSQAWVAILVDRLAMYRSLRDTTVAKFSEARFLEYDAAYSHFVGLFTAEKLGGVRIAARKA